MRKKSRWGMAMLALACIGGMISCATAKNPSSVTQSLMWVATSGDQMVRSYTIQLDDGAVAQVGDAIPTGVQPQAMAITPDGRFLFIANTGDSTIGMYTVTSNGSLSAVGTPQPSGQLPVALGVDPTGKLLFAANQGSSDVSVYNITEGGSFSSAAPPTPLPTPSIALPSSPTALAISPAGSFIYVTDSANNTVVGFSYDSAGALTPAVPGSLQSLCPAGYCVQAGTNPSGLAFSRCAGVSSANPTPVCGNNLFVSNAGSNNISVFSVCIQTTTACPTPDGTLTVVGSPVAACCGPTHLIVDPAADFVYVLEAGAAQVGEFKYSPVTGSLTVMSPASVSTGSSPFSAGITANASNQFNNTNWIFVTNAGVSNVSGYNITSTGRLGILASGPVSVPAQPAAILLR